MEQDRTLLHGVMLGDMQASLAIRARVWFDSIPLLTRQVQILLLLISQILPSISSFHVPGAGASS